MRSELIHLSVWAHWQCYDTCISLSSALSATTNTNMPPKHTQLTVSDRYKDRAVGFKMSLTNHLLRMLSLSDRQLSTGDEDDMETWGCFSMLPVC